MSVPATGGATMTEPPEPEDVRGMFADERVQTWMEEHLPELRQTVVGQRILYTTLVLGSVVGLATHAGGYALLQSAPPEPLRLGADLLYALGFSLWTGVVVVLLVQVIPVVKRRQIRQAVEAYEALQQEESGTSGEQ
jgi:hypothetical protein